MRKKFVWLGMVTLLTGCASARLASKCCDRRDTHERLHGGLWYQTTPEFFIASSTAFLLATKQFDAALADTSWTAAKEQESQSFASLPPAVILDIDETVLDNSPFQARLATDRTAYSQELFDCWVNQKAAKAMPGAKTFLDHVVASGAEIIYVTNRTSAQEQATLENLRTAQLPATKSGESVLSKGEIPAWTSEKKSRREEVAKSYRILLLIGDDLGDFVEGSKKSASDRRKVAEAASGYWGTKWILLPNPLYGSWEQSLYDFNLGLGDGDILKRKFESLSPFDTTDCASP